MFRSQINQSKLGDSDITVIERRQDKKRWKEGILLIYVPRCRFFYPLSLRGVFFPSGREGEMRDGGGEGMTKVAFKKFPNSANLTADR